jgi:hypothetical protein
MWETNASSKVILLSCIIPTKHLHSFLERKHRGSIQCSDTTPIAPYICLSWCCTLSCQLYTRSCWLILLPLDIRLLYRIKFLFQVAQLSVVILQYLVHVSSIPRSSRTSLPSAPACWSPHQLLAPQVDHSSLSLPSAIVPAHAH